MKHVSRTLAALFVLGSAVLGGCDLFGPDGDLYAGVVVEQGTGVPVEGIHVSLQRVGSVGNTSIIAEAVTDSAGRFRMRASGGAIFVNSLPYGADPSLYNPDYSGGVVTIGDGDRTRIRIEIINRRAPTSP